MKYDFIFKCPLCEGVAFEYKEMPQLLDRLEAKKAYLPKKGMKPNDRTPVVCDNCDKEIPLRYLLSLGVSKK